MIFTPAPMSASAASCAVSAGNRDDAHDDVPLADRCRDVVDRVDGHVSDPRPDLLGIALEDGRHRDAVLREDRRAGDRAPEPACSRERDVVLPLRPQDLADLLEQRLRPVADSALPEPAERREIAPDLGRVDVRVLGDLLRRDPLLAHLPRLAQHLEVPAQAGGHSHCQALGHASPLTRFPVCDRSSRFCQRPLGARGWNRQPPSRALSAAGSTKCVNARSPSISSTGRCSRYRASSAGRRRWRRSRARTSCSS